MSAVKLLAVFAENKLGQMARVTKVLADAGVNIEYVYAFTFHKSDRAVLVFRFDDPDKALEALKAAGRNVLGDIDLFE